MDSYYNSPLFEIIKCTKRDTPFRMIPQDILIKIHNEIISTIDDRYLLDYGLYGEIKKRVLNNSFIHDEWINCDEYRYVPDIITIIRDGRLDILQFLHENEVDITGDINPIYIAASLNNNEIRDWYIKEFPEFVDSDIFNIAIKQADYKLMKKLWKINHDVYCDDPQIILVLRQLEVIHKRKRYVKQGKNIMFKETINFLYNNIPECKKIYIKKHGVRKMKLLK